MTTKLEGLAMKGRKRDRPGLQAIKGHPSKRKTKAEKQEAEALRLAELLATAPGSENDPTSPPRYLDKRFAPALVVWKEYAPRLKFLNMLDALHRHTFAAFCVWMGEFVIANEYIQKQGYSVMVKTISGDKMPRENPNVSRRETAMKFVMQLSEKFGFTPLDQHKLMKEMSAFAPNRPDLFQPQPGNGAPASDPDTVGAMDNMDSPAPKPLPN